MDSYGEERRIVSNTGAQQHSSKIQTLLNRGEQQARGVGKFGIVSLNHGLNHGLAATELKPLSLILPALSCKLSPKPPSREK